MQWTSLRRVKLIPTQQIDVLWNTLYMDKALNYLRNMGETVLSEDVVRLSPLGFRHINFLGRYDFTLEESFERNRLRPLRDTNQWC